MSICSSYQQVGAEDSSSTRPSLTQLTHLQPRDLAGCLAVGIVIAVSALGLGLSLSDEWLAWLLGQLVLALAFLQWFVILHEAGHKTLFRTAWLNYAAGHLASVFSLIPFFNWQRIHARHHKFTGWQDLDATTALLVPREIKPPECCAINLAWATGFPVFSVLYRIQNYWNLPRMSRFLTQSEDVRTASLNALGLSIVYLVLVVLIGPATLLYTVGLALLLSLMAQDIILLSQHTHMPRHLSNGRDVRCFSAREQEQFTRSLRLPGWLSRLLLGFDLHELHHMYVRVPGYDLHRIPYKALNQVNWFVWLRGAKALSGVDFLFSRRERTGFNL